jgi:hypothetical protein
MRGEKTADTEPMGIGVRHGLLLIGTVALALSGCDFGKTTGISFKPGFSAAILSP